MIPAVQLGMQSQVCRGVCSFKFNGTCLEGGARTSPSHWEEGGVGEYWGRRPLERKLSPGTLVGAKAASLPLTLPHALCKICLMFIKHPLTSMFLHFREITFTALLNNGSSFKKYKEKTLGVKKKRHQMNS